MPISKKESTLREKENQSVGEGSYIAHRRWEMVRFVAYQRASAAADNKGSLDDEGNVCSPNIATCFRFSGLPIHIYSPF